MFLTHPGILPAHNVTAAHDSGTPSPLGYMKGDEKKAAPAIEWMRDSKSSLPVETKTYPGHKNRALLCSQHELLLPRFKRTIASSKERHNG